jgi:phage recombination protein Bet
MARAPMEIAVRINKPSAFNGTQTAWNVLCDLYPAAETPEIIMAVMEYCTMRKLDPFKRPVHIVAMYNTKLRRKVQVVMQGINEIEITAARSGKWAGMDAPVWGRDVERTFRGQFENDDGSVRDIEVTLTYPLSCKVTVYRLVGGTPRAFTEELFWDECYGRAGFRSEVPNARWQQARRQMIHKCTKSAVLRAAFPEDITEYSAEEMDGHEIDAGGITIDATPTRPPTPPRRETPQHQVDAMDTGGPADEPDAPGDYRIATPSGGFVYEDPIEWLAGWDKLLDELKNRPNDLRALRAMNRRELFDVAAVNEGAAQDVETRLARLLDQPRGDAR